MNRLNQKNAMDRSIDWTSKVPMDN